MSDETHDTSRLENIRTTYNQLCESYRAIDDFRTKLLAFLPLASGAGIFLLIAKPGGPAAELLRPIGAFGFLTALGLYIFEIYGIRKCTHLIVVGEYLEEQLGIGGQFKNRPTGIEGVGVIPKSIAPDISEPFASGIIYPAVLGAWAFVALYKPGRSAPAGFLGVAVFVVGLFASVKFSRWLRKKDALEKADDLRNRAHQATSPAVNLSNQ
ncbi:MAG: hypothetical protein V7609_1380 [Verrucomicrobiota bacterium]